MASCAALVSFTTSPAAAAIDSELEIVKTIQGNVTQVQPGDTITYDLTVTCRSNEAPTCTNAVITDSIPAPFVLDPPNAGAVSVNYPGGPVPVIGVEGNDVTVDFGPEGIGAGDAPVISVRVTVPDDISGDWDQQTVTNTAAVVADNAELDDDSVGVTLNVEQELATEATKSVTPGTPIPAVPGRDVTYTIGGANTSNFGVDSLVIQDPDPAPATEPWNYLEFTGLGALTPPAGADTVQFDWFDGTSWHTGQATTPIPADANDLIPGGTDLASIQGVRFTFTNSQGTLPPSGQNGASVQVHTQTKPEVVELPADEPVVLDNTSSSIVNAGEESASDEATAAVTIVNEPPQVEITKSFSDADLLPGDQTTATLHAANGTTPVHELTIAEPGAEGDPDLVDQGLVFEGFTDGVTWPEAATSASITYVYADGTTSTESTTTAHTLPDPEAGKRVAGFTITFTSDGDGIDSQAEAIVPFDLTAEPVPGDAPVTTTNTTSSTVTTEDGAFDDDDGQADVTRQPLAVDTEVTKNIVRDWIYAVPGATTSVNLTGSVTQDSTVGSDYLTISDPADPSSTPSEFWNVFNLSSIGPVDVPANADLTVEYWDGESWQTLQGPITGPADGWSYSPTSAEQEAIEGIRFVFTPKDGETLPPGFNVSPNFTVEVRDEKRDGTPVEDPDGEPYTVANDAQSEVHNDDAVEPTQTDEDGDEVELRPIEGAGPDLVDKVWLDQQGNETDNANYIALSGEVHTARIKWGTGGLALDQVRIVDDPSYDAVSESIYDAFDLVSVHPIQSGPAPAGDPLIAQTTVTSIELYQDGAWVDPVDDPCPCVGGFPGYDLSPADQESTLAVRLTFEGTNGPLPPSYENQRPIDLDFRIRTTLRSDPTRYVLGTSHPEAVYNNGAAGLVDNTVHLTGTRGADTYESADDITATILDRPLNVSLTKEFDQDQLGLPPPGTPAEQYPLITATLTARNETASKVVQLSVADPSPGQADPTAYDVLDLHQIGPVTPPPGANQGDSYVELTHEDGGTEQVPITVAEAMSPDDLADVVGVRVVFRGNGVSIASQATAVVELTFQLRQTKRSGGPVEETGGDLVTNLAQAGVESPGGTQADTPTAEDDDEFAIVAPDYGVEAGKSIDPDARFEDDPDLSYVATLTGRPQGTARTTLLTITDTEATFWNAFDFTGVAPIAPPTPVSQLRLDVLTGVTFAEQGGDLVMLCDGDADLDPCWENGEWVDGSPIALALPDGVSAGEVRGVRVQARRVVDGVVVQWEKPANPLVSVPLQVTRRATLVHGPGGDTDTPVPSDRPDLDPAPGETEAGVISDTVDVHGEASWIPDGSTPFTADDSADAQTRLRHRSNAIKVEKTPGRGTGSTDPAYDLGNAIPYRLTVTNTGEWTMTGLEVTDQIDPVDGSSPLIEADVDPVYAFVVTDAGGQQQDATGFSASLDPATGVLAITSPADFLFPPGWTLQVAANLQFRPGLPAGTSVGNSVTATSDRPFEQCEFTEDANLQDPITDLVEECTASTHVTVNASAPISLRKLVKGEGAGDPDAAPGTANYDDLGVLAYNQPDATQCGQADADGYYAFPCVPITRPGSLERWKITFANQGNVPANVIAAIDTLPRPGDTGVTIGTQRNSRWAPTLVGDFQASIDGPAGALTRSVYYSTTVPSRTCNSADILNETRPDGLPVSDGCYADVQARDWIPITDATTAEELASAQAIKAVVRFTDPADGLLPGERGSFSFLTQTPWVGPVSDTATTEPIAWNAVAAGSRRAYTNPTYPQAASLVVEPQKVGVALASGRLELRKVVEVAEDFPVDLPDSYQVRLECTSGPEEVTLRGGDAQTDRSQVVLPADGTVVHYNDDFSVNLPLYSDCTAVEDPEVLGATVTVDPESVTALRDYSGVANVAHPWGAGTEAERLTVTNTFPTGAFTVTKAVDNGGAVDQDGDPIAYESDYAFLASCTYLDEEVVPEDERAFTLGDGDQQSFSGLPIGSECTVTETDAAGAVDTSIVLTQGEDDPVAVDGTAVSFTITDVDASVTAAYTNAYTVGSVSITKQVTGPGADAWGNEDFRLRLVCTLDAADPDTVYDATHVVTKQQPIWQVDHLPTGAECEFTEPGTGGANATELPEPFVVGDQSAQEPLELVATNTFTVGSLQVRKVLLLEGQPTTAEPYASGSYTVSLECTRVVNGATVHLAIPGGAQRVITGAGTASYEGLPTGASCALKEVASAPVPQSVVISPAGPYVIGDGTVIDPIAVTVTNDFSQGGLVILKDLTGAGADEFGKGPFHFSVACTLAGTTTYAAPDVVLERHDGETPIRSGVLAPIPVGSECVVTETDAAGADETPAPVTVTIVEDEQTDNVVVAGFVNAYSAGTVSVHKVLDGDAADLHRNDRFKVLVTCQREVPGEPDPATVFSRTLTVRAGPAVVVRDAAGHRVLLPLGTHCFAEETADGSADEVSVNHDSYDNAAVVTAGSPSDLQTLRIEVVNTFEADTSPGNDDNDDDNGGRGPGSDDIPNTGGPSRWLLLLAGVLVVVGGLLIRPKRRR